MTTTAQYQDLLIEHKPRVIRTTAEHKRSLAAIDRLMRKEKLTAAERELLELLSVLVERYEEEIDPAPDVPPHRLVAHLLRARGATQMELSRATGLARSVISEIVSGRKGVSFRTAKKLGAYFGVSPTLFLSMSD
jgi:HTH-type transcriptional regulator/antitoxin HigA